MSGRKPRSSISSASSRTSDLDLAEDQVALLGQVEQPAGGADDDLDALLQRLRPAARRRGRRRWPARGCRAWCRRRPRSRATCTHSSRVGTTTSACGTPSPPSAGGTTRCSIGTPKPRVLPVPVRAWPMRSWPASASGRVSSWMAKVRVIPTSASAATMSGCTSKSLNSGLSGATGAPPSSSTCDSSSSGAGAPVSACSRATARERRWASVAWGCSRWRSVLSPLVCWGTGSGGGDPAAADLSRSVVAGSVPAPTQPAEPGVREIGPGDSPGGASSSGRQRTDTQRARTARRFPS